MWKILLMLLTGVIVSLYYFPFEFTFLPGINTKMILAVWGLIIALVHFSKKRRLDVSNDIVKVVTSAIVVSLIGFVSIVINDTRDYAYATYFISMSVWLSAAFCTCNVIKFTHSNINVTIVINYLMAICVIQCFLALLINQSVVVKSFINDYFYLQQEFLDASNVKRLYGVGAALDTAGIRFSAVLIMISMVLVNNTNKADRRYEYLYLLCFFIIAVVGSMISRTTGVGIMIAIIILFLNAREVRSRKLHYKLAIVLLLCIPVVVYFYNQIPEIKRLINFGFEAFFNLFETGDFSTSSTDRLKTMYVFPETLRTWVIGDGYFSNPYSDPYYIGKHIGGFYMGTDVGYIRFIFYFGIIGLVSFVSFMYTASKRCMLALPKWRTLFVAIFILGLIVWLKVATDVFLVIALFLCVGNMDHIDSSSTKDEWKSSYENNL